MKKVALFAFNGEAMCFVHALLNALEMKDRGYDVKLIVEGTATKLIRDLAAAPTAFSPLYERVKAAGLIDCVCQACARKMGSYDEATAQGLTMCGEMMGHPSMARYREDGYELIVF
ncbi:MAG: cytoplasmic protein [Pseudomonadota bacterium]|nr:cytoplasmic protein [Pseudomonadota bacterium]